MTAEKTTQDLLWAGEEDEELRRAIWPRLGTTREENWSLMFKGYLEFLLHDTKGRPEERSIGLLIKDLVDNKLDPAAFFKEFTKIHGPQTPQPDPILVQTMTEQMPTLRTYLTSNGLTINGLQDAIKAED